MKTNNYGRREFVAGLAALGLPAFVTSNARAQAASGALRSQILGGDKRPVVHPSGSKFGCYDPHGDFSAQGNVSTEHLFLPWEDVDLTSLPAADAYAMARKRKVLVTIEPWSWGRDWKLTSGELRNRILSGSYDANMVAIVDALSRMQSPIIIRWAQEMEDTIGRFSWAGWAPKDYIAAFKRMNGIIRARLPKASIMWSPKGMPNMNEYYPGDDELDIVGLSVFGLDEFDMIEAGKLRSFAELLEPGYRLGVVHNKPVWVAELAYEARIEDTRLAYLEDWANSVTKAYPQFPELKEVVYFNDREVHPWPHNLGLPEWRVMMRATN